ncbi:MAG: trigger factor [Deltaproteobacteria bacterium]|nr:trigger factor [Deltaproteobacteria bacterium]
MKTHLKNTTSTKKKIRLEVPVSMVNDAFDAAYKKIRAKAVVKGFRQGKVPDAMLDKHYLSDVAMESVNALVNRTWPEALKEHGLAPVLQPRFEIGVPQKGKDFVYEVEVEVKPKFEVKDYRGIPIAKRNAVIEPKEIDVELKRLQESRAQLKPIEMDVALKKGLVATLDFTGTVDGKPFEGGSAKGHILEYGQGRFLKSFEDRIEGMKKGETRAIDVKFPDDYPEATLKGKEAKFTVTLHNLMEKHLPPIDDELAKDIGKENLETVKKEIEQFLLKKKEREFRKYYAEEAIEYLLKKNSFDLPEGLVTHGVEQGKRKKEEVERQLRIDFILDAIAKKESIAVQNADIENRFKQLSAVYRQPAEAVKKHYLENRLIPQLVSQLALEKTLDFVIDNATLK